MTYDLQFSLYKGEKLPESFEYDQEYKPLADFFNEDAKKCVEEMVSKIFVIRDKKKEIVGFVAFTLKSIRKKRLTTRKRRGRYERPAIVIGQLLIDKKHQRKGYGKTVVKFTLSIARMTSKFLPCRLLVVEAFNDKAKKYYEEQLGFEAMPEDDLTLVLDLKPILNKMK